MSSDRRKNVLHGFAKFNRRSQNSFRLPGGRPGPQTMPYASQEETTQPAAHRIRSEYASQCFRFCLDRRWVSWFTKFRATWPPLISKLSERPLLRSLSSRNITIIGRLDRLEAKSRESTNR
jgi:hypothetical protein